MSTSPSLLSSSFIPFDSATLRAPKAAPASTAAPRMIFTIGGPLHRRGGPFSITCNRRRVPDRDVSHFGVQRCIPCLPISRELPCRPLNDMQVYHIDEGRCFHAVAASSLLSSTKGGHTSSEACRLAWRLRHTRLHQYQHSNTHRPALTRRFTATQRRHAASAHVHRCSLGLEIRWPTIVWCVALEGQRRLVPHWL